MLELDRFYPEFMVAIEVQGMQHYRKCKLFAKQRGTSDQEYLELIQECDEIKKRQCKKYGIKLLIIPYCMADEEIIKIIKDNLPTREKPLELDGREEMTINRIGITLKRLYKKNGLVTSDMVRKESEQIYNRIKIIFGGIHNARIYFGIPDVRLPKNTWTKEETQDRFYIMIRDLNENRPSKRYIQEHDSKLYYAIIKYGGLQVLYDEYLEKDLV